MKFISGFIILILLSACGDSTPQHSKLSSDAVILAFGDSLTQGNGARDSESYPAVLESLSGRKVINAGISGEESDAGLKRLPSALEEHNPDLLILCHGGNDFIHQKDLKQMESNVRQMIQLAKNKNIPVVLLGVPELGIFLSTYDGYEEIANSMNVVFIEDLISDVLGDKSMKSDGVHPNNKGYRKMAETIHAVLQESGLL
jgi:acyl-CoA thioesterase I